MQLHEEAGIRALDMTPVGRLFFVFDDKVDTPWDVHGGVGCQLQPGAACMSSCLCRLPLILPIIAAPSIPVAVFKVTEFDGSPRESDEMRPVWFDLADIPFDQVSAAAVADGTHAPRPLPACSALHAPTPLQARAAEMTRSVL